MIKLITGYSSYSADDLLHLGQKVGANLPTIPSMAGVKPTALEINTASEALDQAIQSTGPGRAQALSATFDALAGMLGDLAVNAPQMPNATDTNLAKIGLPIVKTQQRAVNPPDICQNLQLRHGDNPGQIFGKCDPATGNIRTYEAQWTLDPNDPNSWSAVAIFANSRAFEFDGLARGKDVWVRVRARNTVGPGGWSDPATIMVT